MDHKIGMCEFAIELDINDEYHLDGLKNEKEILENILNAITISEFDKLSNKF